MALSAPRDTQASGPKRKLRSYPQKGSTTIYNGSLVVLDAGYAKPGATATGLIAVGCAQLPAGIASQTNSGSDGDKSIDVWEGEFKWANKSGDTLAAADVGAVCYVYDDFTVNKTSTGASKCGAVVRVDSDGVIVKMGLGELAV